MNSNDYELRLKEKEMEIKAKIPKIREIINSLFKLKDCFYGDFKYNEELKKPPYPNNWIQEAIECLENAEREALKIEVNSI
ncbi:MAG: hypothetical protein ACFFDF_25575 [Candidatus Odinarchaeota archaeon]